MKVLTEPQQNYINKMPEGEVRDVVEAAFHVRNALAPRRFMMPALSSEMREDFIRVVDKETCK